MKRASAFKSDRLLQIYSRLIDGETLKKKELAEQYCVTERSIQRDMESLRGFFSEQHLQQTIAYDKKAHGYYLKKSGQSTLSSSEILAVCKILLESQSLCGDEMAPLLDKLTACCAEKDKKVMTSLIADERHNYIQPRHNKPMLDALWELGQAVEQHKILKMEYRKSNGETVCRILVPSELMFSEHYFYLAGFLRNGNRKEDLADDLIPALYRVDRIERFTVTDPSAAAACAGPFQEGEFRKRIRFLYGGSPSRIRFQYAGPSIEFVLDRLPEAEILSEDNGVYTVQTEVPGKGVGMWLKRQEDYVNSTKG